MKYYRGASKSGDGLTNNCMLGPAASLGTVASVQTALSVAQGGKVMNISGCKRIARTYDVSHGSITK